MFAVIVGGMYSLLGPTVGAVLTIALTEGLRVAFGTSFIGTANTIYGLLLILFIIFLPRGIVGLLDAGSVLLEDLETIEVTALTVESFGLVGPTLHEFTLTEVISSTGMGFPAIFFQSGPGIEFTEVTVPADSARFVAEILDTTSPDLDMIVFRDMDDDGVPEL